MATLIINSQETTVNPGQTIFECAERIDVHIPTSCHCQGKCRECLVEVVEGMDSLSPRTTEEQHLNGKFRLSCRTKVIRETEMIRCHTLRRSAIRVEENAIGLPGTDTLPELNPAVTRDGDRILLDGMEIARSTGPIHGLAVDL